jgi:hypothetical protein
MSLVLADIAWWAPLAIIGGALVGLVAGYLLLAFVGNPAGGSQVSERIRFEETSKSNYPRPNVAAFVVVLGAIALIVGLAVGLSVD